MAQGEEVVCEIRYKIDLRQLDAFRAYAQIWMTLIQRYGGTHYGFFLPRSVPAGAPISFAGLGSDGQNDEAIAMFSFPDEESYRNYRSLSSQDPASHESGSLVHETACFTSYERVFLRRL